LNSNKNIAVKPAQVVATLLKSIRLATQQYLDKEDHKKGLRIPGGSGGKVRNCVVGLPAHFGRAQRKLLEEACRLAGWEGHVSTVTESTAATVTYGLFVLVPRGNAILVFDMAGELPM
jgi:actin-like ATPase involved in cell morphogenesis